MSLEMKILWQPDNPIFLSINTSSFMLDVHKYSSVVESPEILETANCSSLKVNAQERLLNCYFLTSMCHFGGPSKLVLQVLRQTQVLKGCEDIIFCGIDFQSRDL